MTHPLIRILPDKVFAPLARIAVAAIAYADPDAGLALSAAFGRDPAASRRARPLMLAALAAGLLAALAGAFIVGVLLVMTLMLVVALYDVFAILAPLPLRAVELNEPAYAYDTWLAVSAWLAAGLVAALAAYRHARRALLKNNTKVESAVRK